MGNDAIDAVPAFHRILRYCHVAPGRKTDRVFDNISVERLWRTVKYEDIYLRDYGSVPELDAGLARYFRFYNEERPHQSLGYRTPAAVYGAVK